MLFFLFCVFKFSLNKKKFITGNSLVVQWLGLGTFTAGARVQSLVGKLRSHKLCSTAKKKKKKKVHYKYYLETLLCFLKKLNIELIKSSNSISGYIPKRIESRDSTSPLHSQVHSSTIHNSQKVETTKMPIGRRDKQNVVYAYTGILFGVKK